MTNELTILGWTLVLALVQIMLPALLRSRENGVTYSLGPRDEPASHSGLMTGRLQRAQNNLLETLPVFAAAVLAAHAMDRSGGLALLGAQLYLAARIVYVPLYAFGVPVVRAVAWGASLAGIAMIIGTILR